MNWSSCNRRDFMRRAGLVAIAAACTPALAQTTTQPSALPGYLTDHASQYATDPRAAAQQWFASARFGLFLHYGVYSLLGKDAWVQFRDKIPVAEYAKLRDRFTADKFDADFITELAVAAKMRYVNITARHHDGFCLWPTRTSEFHSMNSPARRDFIGEMAEQCKRKRLGLFLYHSYGLDWSHPYYFPRSKLCPAARPDYNAPQREYLFKTDADFEKYIQTQHEQLRELLTNYGPIAGIWFDPLMAFYSRPEMFPIEETYRLIRALQPQTLISFKQGATGAEDFAAPERGKTALAENFAKRGYSPASVERARRTWDANKDKHNEICDTLQVRGWGNIEGVKHRSVQWALAKLAQANKLRCNLLLNTGPLGDGSIHADDVKTLRDAGAWIAANGWPTPQSHPIAPEVAPNDAPLQ